MTFNRNFPGAIWLRQSDTIGLVEPGEVVVWRSSIADNFPQLLSLEELARADRYRNDTSRATFVRGRTLIRTLAGAALGADPLQLGIELTRTGKPFIRDAKDFAFSLSHSGPWVVLAVSNDDLGVDIEATAHRHTVTDLARRYFAPAEIARLEGMPENERTLAFIRHWVGKESALKCSGLGIAEALDRTICHWDADRIHSVVMDGETFAISEFVCTPGYVGAVATHHPPVRIRFCEALWQNVDACGEKTPNV